MQKHTPQQGHTNQHHARGLPKSVVPLVLAFIIIISFLVSLFAGIGLVTLLVEVILGVGGLRDVTQKQEFARSVAMFIVALPILVVSLRHFLKKY